MAAGAKRSTIIDVGAAAGVSPKTVSRVFNGEPHVTPGVRERVLAAAEALHYRPNVSARGLVSRRTYLVGLIYERPRASYVVELQKGALERLEGERYRLMVLPVESVADNSESLIALLRSAAFDGVVLAPPACDHGAILDELMRLGMPFARISPARWLERGPSVAMDDVAAAREIGEHVIAQGHRRIGIIKGPATHASTEARLLGYAQAFARHDIDMSLDLIESGDFTFDPGYVAAKRLLTHADPPTAILAQNDEMAAAVLAAARELGLDLPGDLSVVGFDDSYISRIVWPALTTVSQPVEAMAHSAMDGLLKRLAGEEPPRMTMHDHVLLVRQSVGPPPAR